MISKALGQPQRQTHHPTQGNPRRHHHMFERIRFAQVYLAAALLLCFALPASAQVMTVRQELHHDVSPPLVEMATTAQKAPEADIEKEAEPVRQVPLRMGDNPANGPDPVLQSSAFRAPAELAPTL